MHQNECDEKEWEAIEIDKQKYGEYVKEITPVHNPPKSMACAFLVGDAICMIGQFITSSLMNRIGMEQEPAAIWDLLTLIFLSTVLTGLNIYPKIVKFGGAGALVPITGFANSVMAPAIEFRVEGEMFGVGCKIFTIAGPMILYGIPTSWVLRLAYWVGGWMGIFQL